MRLSRFIPLGWMILASAMGFARAAQPPHAAPAPPPLQEIITLTTTDGLQDAGLFLMPAEGEPTGGVAILHLPDGPGLGLLRPQDSSTFVAQGLARAGYPNLSIETRHGLRYPFGRFDEAFADVKAAADALSARGYNNVILAGDGLGSLLAVRYAALSGDTRIKAVIAYAPSADLPSLCRLRLGVSAYDAAVDRATRAVAADDAHTLTDLGDGLVFTAATFLDWYGPDATTSMLASLLKLDRPLLLAAGSQDSAVGANRLHDLAAVAIARKVDTRVYPTGHDLVAARERVIADTLRWLADIGFPPERHVATTVVDVTTQDGVVLNGILYTPAGPIPSAVRHAAVMLVHGWTSDVGRSVDQWLALRLAQQGLVVLAVRTRSSGFRGTVSGRLEDIPKDLRAWADFLGARGYARIFGVGHATGGLWLSTYLAESQDPRFRGAVYLGPTRDLPAYARRAMGDDAYLAAVQEAETAVKQGVGAAHLINVPFPQATFDDDPREPMFLSGGSASASSGFTYYYADAFLSYWGPNSRAVHRDRIAEVKVPVLALGGSRDPQMQGAWLLQFIKAAGGPAVAIFYGGPTGATASFEGFENRVTDDLVGWAEKLP
jgi:pimeloyl-ACP methyl ester carboxylesterase